jgi:hypothetical protein
MTNRERIEREHGKQAIGRFRLMDRAMRDFEFALTAPDEEIGAALARKYANGELREASRDAA